MSISPRQLADEYGVNDHWILGVAQGLGVGQRMHSRLYLISEAELEQLRPVIERLLAARRGRSAKHRRTFAARVGSPA